MDRPVLRALMLVLAATTSARAGDRVVAMRLPEGGNQPQAVIDAKGTVHVVYLEGGKDVYYAKLVAATESWSKPVLVNSQAGSAIATGTIRGAQLAVGKNGRVHVVWNGSEAALPKGPPNPTLPETSKYRLSAPFLYSRLKDDGSGFEKQRSLLESTYALDGGGSVAADDKGNVYALWHALKGGEGEAQRRVWIRVSNDGGKTFSKERWATRANTGACGCCGMRAFVDSKGTLYALYRAATRKVNRDMTLLTSTNGGKSFENKTVHRWKLQACPMSSATMTEGPYGVALAWETNDQVFFAAAARTERAIAVPGSGERKHPSIAVNKEGETLVAWAEGTGWNRGGDLCWQLFDAKGRATETTGHVRGGIRVWGLPTVVAKPDGTFLVVH